MNFKFSLLLPLFISVSLFSAQTNPDSNGKVIGKVFFNYHLDQTSGAKQKSAFELSRTYLGYEYKLSNKLIATVLMDAGKGSASDYSMYVKNAKLEYKAKSWLTLTAGMFGLTQFKDQESFWGYRYVYKSFNDEYKFGSSADIGFMAAIKVHDKFKVDFILVNGDGYKNVQDTNGNTRLGVNFVFTPIKSFVLKAYFDTMSGVDAVNTTKNATISNMALFAGYRMTDNFRVGAEYNILQNGTTYKTAASNKDLKGMSFYSTYNFNKKWNTFARYDILSSNSLVGQTNGWNYSKDGNTIIAGIEYKPVKNINSSLNFRTTRFDDSSKNNQLSIYLNLEYKF